MSTPSHILAATDFSDASEQAVEYAVQLAKALGARLTLVHVFDEPFPYQVPVAPEYTADLRARLEARCAELRASGCPARAVVRKGVPWSEVVSAASAEGADLIVVGTHGRRGLPRWLLGSVAERIVRLAPVPVVAVPTSAPGSAGSADA
jgi:nucleotide-binding universal stress UspA family protein